MRAALCIAALAGVASSAPQLINLDEIEKDFPKAELVKAPVNVVTDIPPGSPAPEIVPLEISPAEKRDLRVEKRDGDCSPYPAGSGPVPSPDTPAAFQSDPDFADLANNAPTPDGYSLVFNNKGASLQASNYMGLYTLTSYDTLTCASKCNQADGCAAFNVYLERDPTVNANTVKCPDPPSTTNYRCTLWGAPVSPAEATNSGQYQASFHVVIAGSNAYNRASPPPAISGYIGPQRLGGAINAPPESGSYMGYQYFPFSQSQGYDPQTCADACDAQTKYDSEHPAADGSFMSCVFFNAYVLSENAIPQGLYCSMYNETWAPSYGDNYGQYRGSDRYTVSESYSYTKSSYNKLPPIGSAYTPNPLPPATSAVSSASSPSRFSSSASSTLRSSSVTAVSSPASSSTPRVSTTASSSASPATSSSAPQATATPAVTCAPTPSNNVVRNGGFECGLSPWIAEDKVHTKHSVSSPGDNSAFAYEFDQTGSIDPDTNMHPASVNQDLTVTVGQAYKLTFRTYFDACGDGFVGVMLNHQPVYTVDACDFGAGAFKDNTVEFTATVSPWNLRFEFIIGEPTAVVKIDNVAVVPTISTATTSAVPPPAASCTNSILQNGGFENGALSPWTVTDLVGSTTNRIVKHGSTNPGGATYSFSGSLLGPSSSQGLSSLTLQQTLHTCAGTNYSIFADYRFDTAASGACSIKIQYPYKSTTGSVTSSSSISPAGTWVTTAATFQAVSSADVFKIVLSCTGGQTNVIGVDNVKIAYYPYNAF